MEGRPITKHTGLVYSGVSMQQNAYAKLKTNSVILSCLPRTQSQIPSGIGRSLEDAKT